MEFGLGCMFYHEGPLVGQPQIRLSLSDSTYLDTIRCHYPCLFISGCLVHYVRACRQNVSP